MPEDGNEHDELARAYEERSDQLYEARAALAEAVSTVTAELNRCREERDRALADLDSLRAHAGALEREVEKQERYAAAMESAARDARSQLAALEGTPAVRSILRARAIVDRVLGHDR